MKTPVLRTLSVPTVGYTSQVLLLLQSKPLPPERWLSKGVPGTPLRRSVSGTSARVRPRRRWLFVPTNAWWAAGLPLYLQGFWLPFLHWLPCHEWVVVVSVQLRLRLTGFAPGFAVIAPPELW